MFRNLLKLSRCFSELHKPTQLLFNISENVATITLNNPAKRNPISHQLLTELNDCLNQIGVSFEKDRTPIALVLKSTGPVFSGGHNLNELKTYNKTQRQQLFDFCSLVMKKLKNTHQPVIAQVNSSAAAAGCQLVASCDMVICTPKSTFSLPGIKSGLFCSTPGVAVARAMNSRKKVFEMLVTGDPISAEEAFRYGMVNKIVEEDKLEEETNKLIAKIRHHSPEVISLGKSAYYKQLEMDKVEDAYCSAGAKMVENLEKEDCTEGINAFLEKRKPVFGKKTQKKN